MNFDITELVLFLCRFNFLLQSTKLAALGERRKSGQSLIICVFPSILKFHFHQVLSNVRNDKRTINATVLTFHEM